ncbi:imelysin family protein [Sulfurimonas sp.]|uniref:imelysin family protein n=1 Tax=Sulfurimonas sp. TaxID=2022749 RepID=UPI003D11F046
MRDVVLRLLLFLGLMLQGCGGENSYDGIHGLKSSENVDVSAAVESIYTIVQNDANTTYNLALEVSALTDDANSSLDNFEALQTKTQELILAYKRVEALYVAEKLQSSMTDIPAYVETFSAGDIDRKEPILNELANILDSNNTTAIEDALYKNAYKSLTGLIYTLYGDQESSTEIFAKMDTRRMEAMKIMIENIATQLLIIQDFYENNTTFLEDDDNAITILLNRLAISSNRLKEWRLGDPGGLTQKYKNDPDSTRFEYYASLSSLEAIKAIIQTHQDVLNNGLYEIATLGSATSEADAIQEQIEYLLTLCESFSQPIESDLDDEKIAQLYNGAYVLQNDYTALINALNFKQDIIEADGD